MAYKKKVDLVRDGQPVNAGATNQPTRQLAQNVQAIKDQLDLAAYGETVFARNVTVETDAKLGMPVYFRADTQQYERAIAAIDVDQTTGAWALAARSHVWGVVAKKNSATSADILLFGYYTLDLAEAVDGTVTAGNYYLSGTTPGKLLKQTPGITVPVLRADGLGKVFVNAQVRETLEDHRHYVFDLVCRPAGTVTPPTPGDRHEIVNPDPNAEGWLPAHHSIFEGKAPANAAFGYNLSEAGWGSLWPPIPTGAAYLEINRGEDKTRMGMGVALGETGQCILDQHGIWWLSDCYGDVPWPTTLDTIDETIISEESDEIECPRHLFMTMRLWFTRLIFKTSQALVTSLRAKEGSRLSVVCYPAGGEATTGDLEIDLDLDFVAAGSDELGATVFKELDGSTFKRGKVTEGIIGVGNNISVVGSIQRRQTPGDTSTPLVHQGIVSISVLNDVNGKELPVDLIRVQGVSEENYLDLPALGLPAGRRSSFRGKIRVPPDGIADGTELFLRFTLLGRVDGTLPEFELTYRRLPAASDTPQAVPTTDTALANLVGVAVDADQYVALESESFEVAAGDQVFFTITRLSDGYTGEIQVIDQRGVLAT